MAKTINGKSGATLAKRIIANNEIGLKKKEGDFCKNFFGKFSKYYRVFTKEDVVLTKLNDSQFKRLGDALVEITKNCHVDNVDAWLTIERIEDTFLIEDFMIKAEDYALENSLSAIKFRKGMIDIILQLYRNQGEKYDARIELRCNLMKNIYELMELVSKSEEDIKQMAEEKSKSLSDKARLLIEFIERESYKQRNYMRYSKMATAIHACEMLKEEENKMPEYVRTYSGLDEISWLIVQKSNAMVKRRKIDINDEESLFDVIKEAEGTIV